MSMRLLPFSSTIDHVLLRRRGSNPAEQSDPDSAQRDESENISGTGLRIRLDVEGLPRRGLGRDSRSSQIL